ncbi:hypothetical protein VE03_05616 [Pseudogymnoascus sp. 23342-1-I1]|nr:hypothetical protein VE03_05616 [Pseudogymnoascus sp. 23342-1-I1]
MSNLFAPPKPSLVAAHETATTPGSCSWKAKGKKKAGSVNSLIPLEWRIPGGVPSIKDQRDVRGPYIHQFLSPREIEITETDAVEIVNNTSAGTWTAVEVTTAFCHRAALAHQLTHCLHEIFFTDAIANAQRLDAEFAITKLPVGPLHGLPISLKDQVHVAGVETTMGYVGWIDTFEGKKGTGKEKVFESEVARELRAAGAILFCKTSVPHTLMAFETVNNIIEYTENPANRNVSCGGSSGGEGALIGLRGSPMGLGTDIGGSIRAPCSWNGLYGLRPSHGRLPYTGVANSMPGQTEMPSVIGPLATSAGSLRLMVKALLGQEPWLYDPQVIEMPWRDVHEEAIFQAIKLKEKGQRLIFGMFHSDGLVNPQPPVRRALQLVESLVKKLGHEVIEWKPPSHQRATGIAFDIYTSDGGVDVHNCFRLSGETPAPQISTFYGACPSAAVPVDKMHAISLRSRDYQQEYLDYWNSTARLTSSGRPVDGIIACVTPFAAAERGKDGYLGGTPWVNLLDYTAVTVPVTEVDSAVDIFEVDYQPISEEDRKIWKNYDPELHHGTPVGVQIVGRRLQEEKMIGIAEMFESALRS